MNLFSLIKSKLSFFKLTTNTIILFALALFFLFIIFFNLFGNNYEGMTAGEGGKDNKEKDGEKDGADLSKVNDSPATDANNNNSEKTITQQIPSGINSAELLNAINSLLQKTNGTLTTQPATESANKN